MQEGTQAEQVVVDKLSGRLDHDKGEWTDDHGVGRCFQAENIVGGVERHIQVLDEDDIGTVEEGPETAEIMLRLTDEGEISP